MTKKILKVFGTTISKAYDLDSIPFGNIAAIEHLIDLEPQWSSFLTRDFFAFKKLQKIAYLSLNHNQDLATKIYESFSPLQKLTFLFELPSQKFLPSSIREKIITLFRRGFISAESSPLTIQISIQDLWKDLSIKEKRGLATMIRDSDAYKELKEILGHHPEIIAYDENILLFAKENPTKLLETLFNKPPTEAHDENLDHLFDDMMISGFNYELTVDDDENKAYHDENLDHLFNDMMIRGFNYELTVDDDENEVYHNDRTSPQQIFLTNLIKNLNEDPEEKNSILSLFYKTKYTANFVWDEEYVKSCSMQWTIGSRSHRKDYGTTFKCLNFQGTEEEEEIINTLSLDQTFRLDELENDPFWGQLWLRDRSYSFILETINSSELQENEKKTFWFIKNLSSKQLSKVIQNWPYEDRIKKFGAKKIFSEEISLPLFYLWEKEKNLVKDDDEVNPLIEHLNLLETEKNWIKQGFQILRCNRSQAQYDRMNKHFTTNVMLGYDVQDPFEGKKRERSLIESLHPIQSKGRNYYLGLIGFDSAKSHPVEKILSTIRKKTLECHPDKWLELSLEEQKLKEEKFLDLMEAKEFFAENPQEANR